MIKIPNINTIIVFIFNSHVGCLLLIYFFLNTGSRNQVGQQIRVEYFYFEYNEEETKKKFSNMNSYQRNMLSFKLLQENPQMIRSLFLRIKVEKRTRLVWLEINGFQAKAFTYFVLNKHYFQKQENEQEFFTNRNGVAKQGDEDSSILKTYGVYLLPEFNIELLSSNIR